MFHGSLFASYTNQDMTARDFFVAQSNLAKPQTEQKDWGGTIGGPIERDKAHFFYSLDRLVYAEGRSNTVRGAAGAELLEHADDVPLEPHDPVRSADQPEQHVDCPLPAGDLADLQPHRQPGGRWPRETRSIDVDRLAGGRWNTVLGNTRVNEMRVGYTHEKNGFTAKEVQDGRADDRARADAEHADLYRRDAQRRALPHRQCLRAERAFSQFVPQKMGGDHDLKFGGQFIYSTHQSSGSDRHERAVLVLNRSRVQRRPIRDLSGAPRSSASRPPATS